MAMIEYASFAMDPLTLSLFAFGQSPKEAAGGEYVESWLNVHSSQIKCAACVRMCVCVCVCVGL